MLKWLGPWEFPIAFVAVAAALFKILELLFGRGRRNPGKPWLNRRDWAAGRVKYSDSPAGTLLAVVAVIFTGIFIAAIFTHPPLPAIVMLSVIAALLDWNAIRLVRRASQYGLSVLELKTVPAVPGGVLAGTIQISRPLIYKEAINVHLACINYDDNLPTMVITTVWQESYALDRYPPGTQVSEIPVYFRIPGSARPSQVNRYDRTEWKLDVRATADGSPYRAWFMVPVFVTELPAAIRDMPDPTRALRSEKPAAHQ